MIQFFFLPKLLFDFNTVYRHFFSWFIIWIWIIIHFFQKLLCLFFSISCFFVCLLIKEFWKISNYDLIWLCKRTYVFSYSVVAIIVIFFCLITIMVIIIFHLCKHHQRVKKIHCWTHFFLLFWLTISAVYFPLIFSSIDPNCLKWLHG